MTCSQSDISWVKYDPHTHTHTLYTSHSYITDALRNCWTNSLQLCNSLWLLSNLIHDHYACVTTETLGVHCKRSLDDGKHSSLSIPLGSVNWAESGVGENSSIIAVGLTWVVKTKIHQFCCALYEPRENPWGGEITAHVFWKHKPRLGLCIMFLWFA